MTKRISVLVADDHTLVRGAIVALLRTKEGIDIVAECDNGAMAVSLAGETKPDIALLDVSMPAPGGVEAARLLARDCPGTGVIILSMHCNDVLAAEVMNSGARGYVLKDSGVDELEAAIRAVAGGSMYMSGLVSRELAKACAMEQGSRRISLTARQRQVLQMIAEGRSVRQMAAALGLSVKTIESHRVLLMHRLGIHHLPGLVKYAIRTGLAHTE